MPKIAEIREIDGAIWARVEIPSGDEGEISLFLPSEVEAVRRDTRRVCADVAREHISKDTDWDTSYWNQACERIAMEIERQG